MNKIKYILIIILIVAGVDSFAQQDPLYTQYMNQLLSINPAYAGAKGVTSAAAIVREQYTTWPENPRTQTFFVHSPITNEMGLGGTIVNDKIYKVNNLGIFADYSYSLIFSNDRYLAFGLKAGVSFYSVALTEIDLGHTDPNDPAFQKDLGYKFLPNAGVGVYYSTPNYYLGFSIPKLISNKIRNDDIETGVVTKEQIHAFFMGGYVFDITRIIKFKPYFMVRFTPNAPMSADITAQGVFYDRLWLGVTYRIGNSIGLMAQIQATKQLKVGYAYDLTTNDLGPYNTGTHEIFLNFDFSFGRGRVRSPRYF
ncbi:MAG: type IX secretion system membrane protein PorP/SprF [Prolixibacteraceae bacterium]|nr:type IX secretion system membrane protein PorP/SprF [Prolixibacteraceae bacterium]